MNQDILGLLSEKGACTNKDVVPGMFFSETKAAIAAAKAICKTCEVLETCRVYAIENEPYGVWGALDEDERRAARRFLKVPSPQARERLKPHRNKGRPKGGEVQPCGTPGAYQRHVRRGEKACDACKAAQALRSRERRAGW